MVNLCFNMYVCFLKGDDFVPDYDPDKDDFPKQHIIPIKGAFKRHSKGRQCPVCPERFTNIRSEAIQSHLSHSMLGMPTTTLLIVNSGYSH